MNSGENYGINSSTFEEVMENNNTISNPEADRNDEQNKGVGEKAEDTVNLENIINKAGKNAAANTVKSKNIFEIFLSYKKANAIVAGLFTTFMVGCGKVSVDTADKDVNADQANLPGVESVINTDSEKTEVPVIQVSIREPETVADSYTNHTEYEVAPGIKDGYDKPGMFIDAGGVRFAAAGVISENLADTIENWDNLSADDQAKEIIKNVAENQTESLADYYCQLPDDLRPISLKAIKDEATMEKAIENLSDEEYGKVLNNFKNKVDESKVGETELNGTYYNAYMHCDVNDGKSKEDQVPLNMANVNHENVELVHTETEERGYKATTLTLRDGTVVKFKLNHSVNDDGKNNWDGCVQSVSESSVAYETTRYTAGNEEVSGAEEITDSAPSEYVSGAEEITTSVGFETTTTGTEITDTGDEITTTGEELVDTGSEGTWGKEGDPHAQNPEIGHEVDVTDSVNPETEVSKETNESTNTGNQGYVDDGGAKPGAGSEQNGLNNNGFSDSGITATGATTENTERLQGNEKQGGDEMNGDNVYNPQNKINEGEKIDKQGNNAQQAAQTGGGNTSTATGDTGTPPDNTSGNGDTGGAKPIVPGGDNFSDTDETDPNNW
ncbi:hypothetical protein IKW73_01180 [Candidatus Saccharibacteria bacterium]|nr:hypothetical protein [Candidatus Saccharibacteria bacterium]